MLRFYNRYLWCDIRRARSRRAERSGGDREAGSGKASEAVKKEDKIPAQRSVSDNNDNPGRRDASGCCSSRAAQMMVNYRAAIRIMFGSDFRVFSFV